MLTIKKVKTVEGHESLFQFPNPREILLDGELRLTAIPALTDPHVHFRFPGEQKEGWITGSYAALRGGVTTVIDMPNNLPPCSSLERVLRKKKEIQAQLQNAKLPLEFHLYLGGCQEHLEEIPKAKQEVIGIKVFMGSSTGDLLMTDDNALDELFSIAAREKMLVSVHAEDEEILQQKKKEYEGITDPAVHSKIRDRSAAIKATSRAIELAAKYGTRLFILHISTEEEMELIRQAKKDGHSIYAEVTPHHLFLTEEDYAEWGTFVQMNPPLRTQRDQDKLWEAIYDGTVDTIGTDHAPHLKEEKRQPYGLAPSGVPGIETLLPLLLNGYSEKRITLEKIIQLTHRNPRKIFGLPQTKDIVLVDLERKETVNNRDLKTRCGWSPFAGKELQGWPIFTVAQGRLYQVNGEGDYSPPVTKETCLSQA